MSARQWHTPRNSRHTVMRLTPFSLPCVLLPILLLLPILQPSTPSTRPLSVLRASGQDDPSPRFDPVVQDMRGWKVHVDPSLLAGAHAQEGKAALSMLGNHLERIALLVTGEQLVKLRKMEIWIERSCPGLENMQYHPGRDWLVKHGHDPRLVKKVHIPRAANLLSRQQMIKHPAVILHELAHAYHDQILGFGESRIRKAFTSAQSAGKYEEVLDHRGRLVRHYALSNHKEYFAEATEAYFYRNDFYPFVAAELREQDPGMYTLLEEIWGEL